MYSIWFHQIRALAGREPGILDLLTPEKLRNCNFVKKEGYPHEYADAYCCAYQPAEPKRL